MYHYARPVVQSIATMRPTKAETTESLARIGNQSREVEPGDRSVATR
jgi:hypothetical protein